MTIQRNWQQRHTRPRKQNKGTIKDKQRKKSLKIPKGGNQIPYIEEEQTTQRQNEEFEDTKEAINQNPYIEEE